MLMNLFAENPVVQGLLIMTLGATVIFILACLNGIYGKRQDFIHSRKTRQDRVFDEKPAMPAKSVKVYNDK